MEEENKIEPQVEVQNETKKFDLKSLDYKKYLPYAGIALAVILLIIILVAVLGGGPKKAVKSFVSGMNKQNASKILKSVDFAGMSAWGYYYDEDDFSSDDYKEFVADYEDIIDEMDKDELKEAKEYLKETMEESFEEINDKYKSYKMKIEKFKDVEKLGKDLYAVDVKISMQAKPKDKNETKEIDESATVTFVVYKNKVVYAGGIGF